MLVPASVVAGLRARLEGSRPVDIADRTAEEAGLRTRGPHLAECVARQWHTLATAGCKPAARIAAGLGSRCVPGSLAQGGSPGTAEVAHCSCILRNSPPIEKPVTRNVKGLSELSESILGELAWCTN